MLIGYARVSTGEQSLDLQVDALKAAGCKKIFKEKLSSSKSERPQLERAIAFARNQSDKEPGEEPDVLVIWRLDRLGRSLRDLIDRVSELQSRGVGFRCLDQHIDTTTSSGRLQFHIFSALAEFERDLIRERTLAGLRSARARGRCGGRPPKLTREQIETAAKLMKDPKTNVRQLAKNLGVSTRTLYRHISPKGEIRSGVRQKP